MSKIEKYNVKIVMSQVNLTLQTQCDPTLYAIKNKICRHCEKLLNAKIPQIIEFQ